MSEKPRSDAIHQRMKPPLTKEEIVSRQVKDSEPDGPDRWSRLNDELAKEKSRRIYYQDLVYSACSFVDDIERRSITKGEGIVCGTVDQPCRNLQDAFRRLVTKHKENQPKVTDEQIVAILGIMCYPVARSTSTEEDWVGRDDYMGTTAELGEKIRAILNKESTNDT